MEKQPEPQKNKKNSFGPKRIIATGAYFGLAIAGSHAAAHAVENLVDAHNQKAHGYQDAAHENNMRSLGNAGLAGLEFGGAIAAGIVAARGRRPEDEPHPDAPSATSVPTNLLPRDRE